MKKLLLGFFLATLTGVAQPAWAPSTFMADWPQKTNGAASAVKLGVPQYTASLAALAAADASWPTAAIVSSPTVGGTFHRSDTGLAYQWITNSLFGSAAFWAYEATAKTWAIVAGGAGYSDGAATVQTTNGITLNVSLTTAAGAITAVALTGGVIYQPSDTNTMSVVQGGGSGGEVQIATYEQPWTISGGVATHTPCTTTNAIVQHVFPLHGASAAFSITASGITAGTVKIVLGGVTVATIGTNGTWAATYTVPNAVASTWMYLQYLASPDFTGSIDAVTATQQSDGVSVIVDNANKYWYRQISDEFVDVRWYGALGDAATDDRLAINRAGAFARATRRGVHFSPPGLLNTSFLPTLTYRTTGTLDLRGCNVKMSAPASISSHTVTNVLWLGDIRTNIFTSYLFTGLSVVATGNPTTTNSTAITFTELYGSTVHLGTIARMGVGILCAPHSDNRITGNLFLIGNIQAGIPLRFGKKPNSARAGFMNEAMFVKTYFRPNYDVSGAACVRADQLVSSLNFDGCLFEGAATGSPVFQGIFASTVLNFSRIERSGLPLFICDTPSTEAADATDTAGITIMPLSYGNRNSLIFSVVDKVSGIRFYPFTSGGQENPHFANRTWEFPAPVKTTNGLLSFPGLVLWNLDTKTTRSTNWYAESFIKPNGTKSFEAHGGNGGVLNENIFGIRFRRSSATPGNLVMRTSGTPTPIYIQPINTGTDTTNFFAPYTERHTTTNGSASLYYTCSTVGDIFIPDTWTEWIIGIGDTFSGFNFDENAVSASGSPTIETVMGGATEFAAESDFESMVERVPNYGLVKPGMRFLDDDGSTVHIAGKIQQTTLTAQAAAGATVLTVADTSNILAGDSFMLQSDAFTAGNTRFGIVRETVGIITSVDSPTQVTLGLGATVVGTSGVGKYLRTQRWTTTTR